jgi:hypothetical protein
LPRSSAELDHLQFGVMSAVAIASGRRSKRAKLIACITQARKPEDLEFIPRKCRNLDYKIAYGALALRKRNQVLFDKLRRAGEATENEMRDGRQSPISHC